MGAASANCAGMSAFISRLSAPHGPGIHYFPVVSTAAHPSHAYLRHSAPALQVRQCPRSTFWRFRARAASAVELATSAVAVAQAPA